VIVCVVLLFGSILYPCVVAYFVLLFCFVCICGCYIVQFLYIEVGGICFEYFNFLFKLYFNFCSCCGLLCTIITELGVNCLSSFFFLFFSCFGFLFFFNFLLFVFVFVVVDVFVVAVAVVAVAVVLVVVLVLVVVDDVVEVVVVAWLMCCCCFGTIIQQSWRYCFARVVLLYLYCIVLFSLFLYFFILCWCFGTIM